MVLMLNPSQTMLLNFDNLLYFKIEEYKLKYDIQYRIIAHFRDDQTIVFAVFPDLELAKSELHGMLMNMPGVQTAYTNPQKVQTL